MSVDVAFGKGAGGEFFEAQQVESVQEYELKTPSDSVTRAIKPSYRLEFDSRIFQITSITDTGLMKEEVVIRAKESS